MSTQTEETYYVKLPGGAIAQRSDGSGITLAYGAPVPVDDLNDASLSRLSSFADTTFRGTDADPNLEALANARTALANAGQVNSGSSPVPGNYAQLTEDDAAALVRSLELYPQSQASILIAEKLFHGDRQKVWDAATEAGRISATMQIEAESGALRRQVDAGGDFLAPTPTPVGDVYAGAGDPGAAQRLVTLQGAEAAQAQSPQPFGAGGDATPAAGATPVGGGGSGDSARQAAQEQAAALQRAQEESRAKDDEIAALRAQLDQAGVHGEGGDASAKVDSAEAPEDYSGFSYKQLQLYVDQHKLDVQKNIKREDLEAAIRAVDGHDKPQTPPLPEDTDPASLAD